MDIQTGYYAIDNLKTGITYIGNITYIKKDVFIMTELIARSTLNIINASMLDESYEDTAKRFQQQAAERNNTGSATFTGLENMAFHKIL